MNWLKSIDRFLKQDPRNQTIILLLIVCVVSNWYHYNDRERTIESHIKTSLTYEKRINDYLLDIRRISNHRDDCESKFQKHLKEDLEKTEKRNKENKELAIRYRELYNQIN